MKPNNTPVVKDLVLVGGGHAHVGVLRMFAMNPLLGLRITVISRDIHTPYSGMLPGLVAGHYDIDECHIDICPLARFAGARLYHTTVEGLDLVNKKVIVKNRPPVSYDILSINTGSTPTAINVVGAKEYALFVKPIDIFLKGWKTIVNQVQKDKEVFTLSVVGAGAGGVEIALAAQYRLKQVLKKQGVDARKIKIRLLTRSKKILPTHNSGVQKRLKKVLKKHEIELYTQTNVTKVTPKSIQFNNNQSLKTDAVIWATNASAPAWINMSGLDVNDEGFIKVNQYLLSPSHANIFASGDIASLEHPRPKSGVFAVRQGPILAANIRATATGKPLIKYKPQKKLLSLITTGGKHVIASYSGWSLEGNWLWQVKNWIDQKFMANFANLPEMKSEQQPEFANGITDKSTIKELSTLSMRCGGCGAKVGATVLSRVMKRLPTTKREDILIGRNSPDDCAILCVPKNEVMVQSVDYFRAFIDDNYKFGAIAANHALGDLFAMGAKAQSVLAIATVPYGRESVVEETLYEMLAGALSIIKSTGAVLAGGHSSEGTELAFGLTVNGLVKPNDIWHKGGMQVGDKLILTKPIGTGTLFAANMRQKAKGRWIYGAIESMLVSSQKASECLRKYGTSACTDLTGFGIIGHLVEMTRASKVDATIYLSSIPLLEGALETVKMGILSSLHPSNLRLKRSIVNINEASNNPVYPLLFDPQTAGGLLATVPAHQADACITQLKAEGYEFSAIIGQISAQSDHQTSILIKQ